MVALDPNSLNDLVAFPSSTQYILPPNVFPDKLRVNCRKLKVALKNLRGSLNANMKAEIWTSVTTKKTSWFGGL